MKNIFGLLFLFLSAQAIQGQNTVKLNAVKANNYGVAYTLPKTAIKITADVTKTIRKTGEYYQYADRYLNISNPITKDEVIYSIDNITFETYGIPDRNESYLVEFKSNWVAPYVTLTEDGLICAINADAEFSPEKENPLATVTKNNIDNPKSYFTEEMLRSGSTGKQIELIAKQIYLLRETRTNILTGEADNMPPDGNAYKIVMEQIDRQEKALTSLFSGTEEVESITRREFTVIPDEEDINRQVVFRFSSKLGIVEANNLAGAPVYLSLINKEPREELFLSDKEQKALEKKYSNGLIYNIPAKANLKIEYGNKAVVNNMIDVVQYGSKEVFTPKELEFKKDKSLQVIFYPDLGAIKKTNGQ
ncbi:DUF4831 family protein [Dysgonomonas sp. 520]|uniref:DUF4831 family protein n=1 Tax=Dysgonomonas sp. 520 TaxID=2302931 RepID=UPI0013D6B72D|nr:DUF4831 family protein [Dysgonomonas sp. 520]NDW10047.1 DUF4831 family protein [Dysgonomonas sp. 520]